LKNHYPTYLAIGLDEDDDVTRRNSVTLTAMLKQFQDLVEGSDDVSNNATFHVVVTDVVADEAMLEALIVLSSDC
jgi:hypothetical protein